MELTNEQITDFMDDIGENLMTLYFYIIKEDLNIVHTGRFILT